MSRTPRFPRAVALAAEAARTAEAAARAGPRGPAPGTCGRPAGTRAGLVIAHPRHTSYDLFSDTSPPTTRAPLAPADRSVDAL